MDGYNLISLLGTGLLLLLAWGLSAQRGNVNWRVVFWGIGLQWLLAVVVFRASGSAVAFQMLNDMVVGLIGAATAGQHFVFGQLGYAPGDTGPMGPSLGFFFAFQVLPIIVVFAVLMQVLYFLGIMQRVIQGFAWVFHRLMRISGAESLFAASSIFVGLESATAVRPYIRQMTRSELCLLLTTGMATVASSIMGAYVQMLQDVFPNIAGHLITASVLSAPAAVVMAKLILPEDGQPVTAGTHAPVVYERDGNLIEAVINGAMAGGRMAVGVALLLIAVISLVAIANLVLGTVGGEINELAGWQVTWTLEYWFGWVFWPLALMMGVPACDAHLVGELLAQRLFVTEVVAYPMLADAMRSGSFAHPRSALIAAYALCGFAHFASMGIFIGGIAALVPQRRGDLSAVAGRALVAATLACLMTGAVAGTLYHQGSVGLE